MGIICPIREYYQTHIYKCRNTQKQWARNHKGYWRKFYGGLKALQRKFIEQTKNKPCADCNGWFEPCQMGFDHRNPKDKIAGVARLAGKLASIETLSKEIAKCDIVCANCHRLRTQKQRQAGLFKYN